MPAALPVIRGTSAALYPFTQRYIAMTGISDSQSANPTRWVRGYPLVRFEFGFNPILQADKTTLKAALAAAMGQFATDRTATTDTAYTNLSSDADEFAAVEQNHTLYGVQWSLSQTLPQNFSPGSSGGAFPGLSNGAVCQLRYTQKQRFQTIVSKIESGPKYTYAEFGGGLANFPLAGLMAWQFDEAALTDAEVATKVAHFLANWGNCMPFSFTDEVSTALTFTLSSGATSAQVASAAALPPAPFYLTFGAGIAGFETVQVTNLSGTALTIVRAQMGTSAIGWTVGTSCSVTYTNVYYASPVLTIERRDVNRSAITTALVQMN